MGREEDEEVFEDGWVTVPEDAEEQARSSRPVLPPRFGDLEGDGQAGGPTGGFGLGGSWTKERYRSLREKHSEALMVFEAELRIEKKRRSTGGRPSGG